MKLYEVNQTETATEEKKSSHKKCHRELAEVLDMI